LGGKPSLGEQVQDAKGAEAGPDSGREHQEGSLEVLPVKNWPLLDRAALMLDEESGQRGVLVVPVQDDDEGACF
jgi:hypothetical protein